MRMWGAMVLARARSRPGTHCPSGSSTYAGTIHHARHPSTTLLGSLGPPLDAFRGVPAPLQGAAGTRRLASIGRTLPHGPFAAATANHSGPRRNYPPATASVSLATVCVVCWPMTLPGDYKPPGYAAPQIKIKNTHSKRYAEHFIDSGLSFQLEVPQQGSASVAEFSRKTTEHLSSHNISFPPCPDDTVDDTFPGDLDAQMWVLLIPRIRKDVYNFEVHPTINDNLFGYAEFAKLNHKFVNPKSTSIPWIFIAPRFGHMLGPVSSFSMPNSPLNGCHPCFGLRMLDRLPPATRAGRNDPIDIDCYVGLCPSDDTDQNSSVLPYLPPAPDQIGTVLSYLPPGLPTSTSAPPRAITPPPPSQLLIRQRSPTSQNATASDRRVRQRQTDSPLPPPAVPEDEPSAPIPPPCPPLIPLVLGVDVLESDVIEAWQQSIYDLAQPIMPTIRPVFIQGKTVRAVAACVLDLIIYIECRKYDADLDFKMEDQTLASDILTCTTSISLISFFLPLRMLEIRNGRRRSGGFGPERAAMRDACLVLASRHNFWQPVPSSEMFRPVLNPTGMALPHRINTFRAHGTFLALHCFFLQHGPLPISIWVLLALIGGREAMLIPKHILLHMDPAAYDILAPWYDWHQDMPIPPIGQPSHPLRLFIYEHMVGIQPSIISDVRTKDEHDGWIISAFAALLLGHPDPWKHPEFIALKEGFNIGIKSMRFTDTIRSRGVLPFLVAIYDRRVKTVEDVSKHLHFDIINRASGSTTAYFAKLFELRVRRYIEAVGHPPQLRMLEVSDEEFIANRYSPLLRATLILVLGSDSDMCPTSDTWGIHFRFYARDVSKSVIGTPLGFHTCFYAIDVWLDRAMQELLLEAPAEDDRKCSEFDVWIHSQFLNREHNSA
ncbi:hypothetical protein B0H10DRAFT_2444595 [Mycena sp. CBHHK59/15]|nr:hypothetical protein B0H10DRAFT_2444595 [Mycena sp. CBHHK59/15]